MAVLGLAGAVAFLVQVSAETEVPGQGSTSVGHQLIIPLAWTTLTALAIPALAAAARTRAFGAALVGGWIIGIFAEIAFVTPFPVSVLGYTLIALALALIPFVRAAPPAGEAAAAVSAAFGEPPGRAAYLAELRRVQATFRIDCELHAVMAIAVNRGTPR